MGELQTSRIIDNARLSAEREAVDKAAEGLPDRLRSSGVLAKGPPQEQYDYEAADLNGVSFTADEGGVSLPLKYKRGATYAGRDAATGTLYQRRNDPNGFGEAAVERMGAAYVNTEQGPSPEVMDGTIPLVIEHFQNGGTPEDIGFALNDDIKMASVEMVKSVASNQVIADKLRAMSMEPDPVSESETVEEPVEESPTLQFEDMVADESFVTSAATVAGYYMGEGGDMKVGGNAVEAEGATPEYIAEKGIEEMAAVYSSMWKMGEIILAVENGSMPPDVQAAYLDMALKYQQYTPWSMDVAQGTLTGMANDLPIYAIMARTGKGTMAAAGKQKAFAYMIQKLSHSTAGKVALGTAPVAAAGGIEGGMLGAGGEKMEQTLSSEDDWKQVFAQGTNEALAGMLLATPFGALFNNQPGRDFIKRSLHEIADGMGRVKTPMNTQGGWVGIESKDMGHTSLPEATDLGVPMADANDPGYYSPIRDQIIEGNLMPKDPNKGTDPAVLLSKLKAGTRKGTIRGYELQDARVEEFLQGKIDAGEKVNAVDMDDFLWANRPRVNSLISSGTDYSDPESMNFMLKDPARLRQSALVSVLKDNYFTTEVVQNADGQKAWRITNKLTGDVEVTQAPGKLDRAVRDIIEEMPSEQVVATIRAHDSKQLLGPSRWGKRIGDRGRPMIINTEDYANNYQEIRLFLPYEGLKNPETVAMERFGDSFDNLTPDQQARVGKIQEYGNTPENAFMDDQHYPLEHNRLVHIRTQELYQPQHGGERVLAVNEFQSDMHEGLKKADKETEGGQFIVENSDGTEKVMPSKQASEGWVQMSLHRTFQVAQAQGYNKVAIPVDENMIAKIQLWKEDKDKSKRVIRFYDMVKKLIGKDKRLQEAWGITDIRMDHVAAAPDGQYVDEKMFVITFDPPEGKKPIYGIAAVGGAEGATMLDDEEKE